MNLKTLKPGMLIYGVPDIRELPTKPGDVDELCALMEHLVIQGGVQLYAIRLRERYVSEESFVHRWPCHLGQIGKRKDLPGWASSPVDMFERLEDTARTWKKAMVKRSGCTAEA